MPKAFDYDTDLKAISTGSLAVDAVTGIGGFPIGRLTEVSGWEGSGKTILCISACAMAQQQGLAVAYIDPEHGVDLHLAKQLGFDYEDERKGVYMTPSTFEESLISIEALANSGEIPLIVLDSIPAMVPKDEIEGKIEDAGPLAVRARMLSQALPKLTKIIAEANVALVMVNQLRENLITNSFLAKFAPKEKTTGGAALKFYSSLRLKLQQVKKGSTTRIETDPYTGKDIEVPIASQHEAEAFKNKVAVPYRKATFYIRYDPVNEVYGIDNLQTICDLAVTGGLVTKSGAYFKYAGESAFNAQGAAQFYDHIKAHPEVEAEFRAALGL